MSDSESLIDDRLRHLVTAAVMGMRIREDAPNTHSGGGGGGSVPREAGEPGENIIRLRLWLNESRKSIKNVARSRKWI